jgi:tRNA (guanine-N7-)-methyltransferase
MIDIDLNAVSVPLDWAELFGRDAPTEIEIGSGKGRFLLERAAAEPARNLLAVERAAKYHALVCERAAKRGLGNVRLLRTTAEDLLFRLLRPASVEAVYVLFPDPWPKKRHHKRRFVTPENVAAVAQALVPGGRLLVKSDHPGYAEVIDEVLAAASGLKHLDAAAAFADLPETGFERKYRDQGRTIFSWALERPGRVKSEG